MVNIILMHVYNVHVTLCLGIISKARVFTFPFPFGLFLLLTKINTPVTCLWQLFSARNTELFLVLSTQQTNNTFRSVMTAVIAKTDTR